MSMLASLHLVLRGYSAAAEDLEYADRLREGAQARFRSACIALLATISLALDGGATPDQVAEVLGGKDAAALTAFCAELERVSGESLSPPVIAALAPRRGGDL